jgi:hypothetical protein
MFNFYQIIEEDEIQIYNYLVIKVLILCQRIISTQEIKLLDEILRYDTIYIIF